MAYVAVRFGEQCDIYKETKRHQMISYRFGANFTKNPGCGGYNNHLPVSVPSVIYNKQMEKNSKPCAKFYFIFSVIGC